LTASVATIGLSDHLATKLRSWLHPVAHSDNDVVSNVDMNQTLFAEFTGSNPVLLLIGIENK